MCACLPTLRPLLRETWLKGKFLLTTVRYAIDRSRRDDGIQLESGCQNSPVRKSTYPPVWIDDFHGIGLNAGPAEVMSSAEFYPERDDTLLAGIHLRQ